MKYTYDASGEHAPTYLERKPWLLLGGDNIFSHNVRVIGNLLQGIPVSSEEAILTAFTSLVAAAALVPIIVEGAVVGYTYAKERGYIK